MASWSGVSGLARASTFSGCFFSFLAFLRSFFEGVVSSVGVTSLGVLTSFFEGVASSVGVLTSFFEGVASSVGITSLRVLTFFFEGVTSLGIGDFLPDLSEGSWRVVALHHEIMISL